MFLQPNHPSMRLAESGINCKGAWSSTPAAWADTPRLGIRSSGLFVARGHESLHDAHRGESTDPSPA